MCSLVFLYLLVEGPHITAQSIEWVCSVEGFPGALRLSCFALNIASSTNNIVYVLRDIRNTERIMNFFFISVLTKLTLIVIKKLWIMIWMIILLLFLLPAKVYRPLSTDNALVAYSVPHADVMPKRLKEKPVMAMVALYFTSFTTLKAIVDRVRK